MTRPLVLAGDIGGTKTLLALCDPYDLHVVREGSFPSRDFLSLEAVIAAFLLPGERVAAAAFGIAGPVVEGAVRTTNLAWHVVAQDLSATLHGAQVRLLNDLETTALGGLHLSPDRFVTIQHGSTRKGTIAVIAAGTGLGQAYLFWDGQRWLPGATEGGHADFAPSTARDVRLLDYAQRQYGHVSWERVVSGPGLNLLFRFLTEELERPVATVVRTRMQSGHDPSAVIGEAALAGQCDTCSEAVDWFVRLYAAQAGNLVLSVGAFGGVWIGGGIVTKLLPAIDSDAFREAFAAKGRYQGLLRDLTIRAILEPRTSLLGAAAAAAELASSV